MLHKINLKSFAALILLLLFALPQQSSAQESTLKNKSDAWWNLMEQQLSVSLDKEIDQVRDETLKHIVFFANNYSSKIDLHHLAPQLLDIYQTEKSEARRTMAVVALHAIGNQRSMVKLAQLVQTEPSGSLRNITLAAISDYSTRGD